MVSKHSTNENGIVGKICSKCRLWYSLDRFGKDKSRKDGLNCWCKECLKEYAQSEKGKMVNTKAHKKYDKSIKGKIKIAKSHAKGKGLGWNPVYANLIIEPHVWHHINNDDVVAIPRDLHYAYNPRYYSLGLTGHIFMLNQIIKQLYR